MAEETTQITTEQTETAVPPSAGQTTEQKTESSVQPPAPIIGGPETIKTEETTGEKAEGEKGPEEGEKKPETRAPEEYANFSLPEGVTMDETQTVEFKSFAKEQDLTQEQAQKVLEFGGAKLKALVEAPYKEWSETQKKWQAEVKADPDIGGTKYEESVKAAAMVFVPGESNPFVKTGEEAQALRQALFVTGAGNNPAMVKFFVNIGRLLAEPGPLRGAPVALDKQGDLLAKMYPMMSEQT